MTCKVPDCIKVAEKRGWCAMHYRRWRVHGDVNVRKKAANGEAQRYFEDVVLPYAMDECLIWPYSRNAAGYATLGKGLATRVLCKRIHGAPPTPKHEAAHTCGNGSKGCLTGGHLVWKTRAENEKDKIGHGTSNRGERSGNAKLTNADVHQIRRLIGKQSLRSIARAYDVTLFTIQDIRDGKRWAWLMEEA